MSNHTPFKFPLPTENSGHGQYEINMPKGARILTVQTVRGEGVIYAMVNPGAPVVARRVCIVGTGRPAPADDIDQLDYIGTYQKLDGQLVWHVFIAPERNEFGTGSEGDQYVGKPVSELR